MSRHVCGAYWQPDYVRLRRNPPGENTKCTLHRNHAMPHIAKQYAWGTSGHPCICIRQWYDGLAGGVYWEIFWYKGKDTDYSKPLFLRCKTWNDVLRQTRHRWQKGNLG